MKDAHHHREIAMYNVRIRKEEALADVSTDGRGIAARAQRGTVRQFGSLVEAQELAKMLKSMRRLG
ncbi:MAG TPA: hypothetical protein VHR17_12825 [Thermoanaerobaculia bacterium]|nr:hypothetical protein [Thermoanaerobaculia bacterium]